MEGLLLWTITTVLALLYQSSSTNGQTCVSRYESRLVLTAQTDVDISLLSPAFHNSNPSNFECVWTITAAKGYVVMVNFTKFTIVSPKDFSLKLFDSYADRLWRDDKYLIGYYNLSGLPPDMFSSGTSMHLLFDRAKVAPEGQQFKLTYRAVKPRPDPTICSPFNKKTVNKNIILPTSADQGTFHSPLYPNPYPSNIECTWTIQIPSGTIELYFDDFRLEGDSNKCLVSADTVQVNRTLLKTTAVPSPRYVGNTTVIPTVPSYIVNTLCGQSSPRVDLDSTTGYMSVTFKSNLNNEVYFGFKATWKRIKDKAPTNVPNPDVCSAYNTIEQNWNVRVSTSSGRGRITNPYQSGWPYSVVACRWQIEVPEGSKIKLDFGEYSFYLRGRLGECYELDSVSIFDAGLANAGNGTKVKTLCGNFFRTAEIQSTGRFITIAFKGDPSRYTNQFEIKWETVDEATNVGMIVGVVIGCVILIVIVAVVTWYFVRRRRETNKPGSPSRAESVPLET